MPADANGRRLVGLTLALWTLAAAVAIAQVIGALTRPMHDRLADLQVYIGAVRGFIEGASLYDFAAVRTEAPFTYPPFAGITMIPLAYVDSNVLMVGWTCVTVLVVFAIAKIVSRSPSNLWTLPNAIALPVLALALFASSAVSSNLRFGQVSVMLVLLVLLDALKIIPQRYAGIATGLAAAIKLTPLIFIPYLWITGQRRAAVTAIGTFVAATAAAWAVLPGESLRYWGTELMNVDRVGNIVTGGNQSLNGAMLRLNFTDTTRTAVIATLGVVIVLLAYWRARRAARDGNLLASVVIVGAASIVFSPVSWTHHQLWLVLAALIPVSRKASLNLAWAVFVAAVMILPITSVGSTLPGGVVFGNARLLLAIAVAALIPVLAAGVGGQPSSQRREHDGAGLLPIVTPSRSTSG